MFWNENFQQKLTNTPATSNLLKRFIEAGVAGGIALIIIFFGVFVGETAPIPLIYNREEVAPPPEGAGQWLEVGFMWPRLINILPPDNPYENGDDDEPPETTIDRPSAAQQRELERLVGERINLYRESWDMPPLRLNHARLNDVARYRAREISRQFSRYRPDGTSGLTLYPAFNAASENISRGPTAPHSLMNTWIVSVNHREALFDYHEFGFDAVGIGLYVNQHGEHFWVAAFINERTAEQGEVTQDEIDRWWEENRPDEEQPEEEE